MKGSIVSGLCGLAFFTWAVSNVPGERPGKVKTHALNQQELSRVFAEERAMHELADSTERARKMLAGNACDTSFAEDIAVGARDNGLPVRVVTSVVVTESSCRPAVVSTEGAVGLMQVNPRVWHYDRTQLKDAKFNIQVGSRILGGYVHRYGLTEGLHRYNGLGEGCSSCDAQYAEKVLVAANR